MSAEGRRPETDSQKMKVPTELPIADPWHGNNSTGLSNETASFSAYVYFVKDLEGLRDENGSATICCFIVGGHGHTGLATSSLLMC
jgi:hypothetical protein